MRLLTGLLALASFGCGPIDEGEEVEASSELSVNGGMNVALATKGATAIGSSEAPGAPASALIDGNERGVGWGSGGGWSDYTYHAYPDSVVITFAGKKLIDEIDVFSLQDDYANPVEPVQNVTTFSKYGARNFTVATWNGSSWVTVGLAINNSSVWRKFVFAPVATTKIRVHVSLGGTNGWTQLTEVQAWTAAPGGCASYCDGGLAIRACDATCTAAGNIASTCGQQGYVCVGGVALPSCTSVCNQWSSCFDRCSAGGVASTCESVACDRPRLRGEVSTTYLDDVNRCVDNPIQQVLSLAGTGVVESFAYPDHFPEASSWDDCLDFGDCGDHWQTVVRLPADPNRFLVTLNQEEHPNYSGYLGILDRTLGAAQMMQRVDASVLANRYNHPGGAQALGTGYAFVGEEQEDAFLNARVRIYEQETLVDGLLQGVNPHRSELPSASTFVLPSDIPHHKGAAAVAAAKLRRLPGESGPRYLMLVASQDFSFRLYYWISQPGRPLSDPRWEKGGYLQLRTGGDTYINGWGKQQNMNLLTDCASSELYLISWGLDDGGTVRLHQLHFHLEHAGGGTTLVGSIGSGTVATRDVGCDDDDYCYFGGGAGSYVDANGDLQVYGASKKHQIRTTGFCKNGDCAAP